jgi:hypothetical protein
MLQCRVAVFVMVKDEVTSIDLLEECFSTIYQIRKCSKALKRNQRSQRDTKIEPTRNSPAGGAGKSIFFEEGVSESSPSLSGASSSNLNNLPYLPRGGSKRDIPAAAPPPSKTLLSQTTTPSPSPFSTFLPSAPSAPSISASSSTMKGFATLEDQKHDKTAIEIYDAFKKEIRHWWVSNPAKRSDEDLRGDLADDLTERYLCQRLDPLPASRVVTNIRKTISTVIEDFASGDGTLPAEILSPADETVSGTAGSGTGTVMTQGGKDKQAAELKARHEENERKLNHEKGVQENTVTRAEAEKRRIKEQYESYMKIKNQAKGVEREDEKREADLEDHLDDIRSLISSIKGGGGGK